MASFNDRTFTAVGVQDWSTTWVHQPDRLDPNLEPLVSSTLIMGHAKTTMLKQAGLVWVRLIDTGTTIAPGSLVSMCELDLFSDAIDTAAMNVEIAVPGLDGLWNQNPASPLGGMAHAHDIDVRLVDTLAASFVDTNPVPAAAVYQFPIHRNLFSATFGQAVLGANDGHSPLASAVIQMHRVGLPGGNISWELYRCVADDGSDDRPTGAILDTSATLTCDSLGTTTGPETFTFPGAIAMNDDRRYVLMPITTYSPTGTKYIVADATAANQYVDGSLVGDFNLRGNLGGPWSNGRYPGHIDVPHLYDQSGVAVGGTARTYSSQPAPGDDFYDPFSPIVTVAAPSFAANNTWYTFPNLAPLLHWWVNHPSYVINQDFALILGIKDGPFSDVQRSADSVRLRASWTEPDANGEHDSGQPIIA